MNVRWGLDALSALLEEAGVRRPLLVSTARWSHLELPVEHRFYGALTHTGREGVDGAIATARASSADGLVALGGGSAINTGKATSAALGLPLIAIPTTYAGSEWTPYFGILDRETGAKTSSAGAHTVAIVYDARLTLQLPAAETAGSALNALAHCAEALYATTRTAEGTAHALSGARLIVGSLPDVLRASTLASRDRLLQGAMHGGAALAASGLALGHAIAQVLGGRLGIGHGAANAIALPAALDFNRDVASAELRELATAMGVRDAAEAIRTIARGAGFTDLGALGVDRGALPGLAEPVLARPGAQTNPIVPSREQVVDLLDSLWDFSDGTEV